MTLSGRSPLLKRKDALPVVLHIHDGPFIHCCSVQGFVETTEGGVPVIGVFAFRVGVMNNQAKAAATADAKGNADLSAGAKLLKV